MPEDTKQLDRLLGWLALYVLVLLAVCGWGGKLADAIPVITNLVSGFAGAAFTIMNISGVVKPKTTPVKEDPK